MDYRMPVKDGVTATREIINITPTIKILFVSADDSVIDRTLDAGAMRFLSKPLRSKQLLAAIDEALGIMSVSIVR